MAENPDDALGIFLFDSDFDDSAQHPISAPSEVVNDIHAIEPSHSMNCDGSSNPDIFGALISPFTSLPLDQFTPGTSNPQSAPPELNSQSPAPGSQPDHQGAGVPNPTLPKTIEGSVPPPKIGTRFSKNSLKVLRNWLAAHEEHPFPTAEDREILELQTGLTKTQILTWLANARRRGKFPVRRTATPRRRSPSPDVRHGYQRAGTPAPHARYSYSPLDPLQRWVESPPDQEPASESAIALAVASSDLNPYDGRDGLPSGEAASGSSQYRPSPASSTGNSRSSSESAYSFESRDSGFLSRSGRHRRKTRTANQKFDNNMSLTTPSHTYQCTFCTETFRTKHVWQRHEKSLHIAPESWVCIPQGLVATGADRVLRCVFCQEPNPTESHMESHNYKFCHWRSIEERTFHRKDHLGQHLRLVHNLRPQDLGDQLNQWKVGTPKIRSTCGFCGITMSTWEERKDHLADHFKSGCSMAEWKGDWGFDAPVLERLENALLPYMIAHERMAPFPFAASFVRTESPRNPYELIKIELMNFIEIHHDKTGKVPNTEELQLDACRIIFAAETPSYGSSGHCSWLRDLIMSVEEIVQRAKMSPLRSAAESKLAHIGIIGKEHPFDGCPFEAQLQECVKANEGILSDQDLQSEACRIILQVEAMSLAEGDIPSTWLLELARSSTGWLRDFRERASIPTAGFQAASGPSDQKGHSSTIDSILSNYDELERHLMDFVMVLRAHGTEPDDSTLLQQGLKIISTFDNASWRDVAAKNHSWLARFKRRHIPWSDTHTRSSKLGEEQYDLAMASATRDSPNEFLTDARGMGQDSSHRSLSLAPNFPVAMKCFLNDPNLDRWVSRGLRRWVAATMSPHNPKQHIPSDEELQHQARWIMYEDDDPLNQSAADNAEWLRRFKREVGILKDGGPGLNGNPTETPKES